MSDVMWPPLTPVPMRHHYQIDPSILSGICFHTALSQLKKYRRQFCGIGALSFQAMATMNSYISMFQAPESRDKSSRKQDDLFCRRRYSVDQPSTSNKQHSGQFGNPLLLLVTNIQISESSPILLSPRNVDDFEILFDCRFSKFST